MSPMMPLPNANFRTAARFWFIRQWLQNGSREDDSGSNQKYYDYMAYKYNRIFYHRGGVLNFAKFRSSFQSTKVHHKRSAIKNKFTIILIMPVPMPKQKNIIRKVLIAGTPVAWQRDSPPIWYCRASSDK